jgi:tyrosyl-tRNA synthetase
VVLTVPLLEGLDGVNKMSKSLGNYIGIDEPADEIFGKIMSISDELMWRYFELLSFSSLEDINKYKEAIEGGANPRDIKFDLAMEIVARFHDKTSAEQAKANFIERFRKGAMPDDIPEVGLDVPSEGLAIANVLKLSGLVSSTSDGLRMIKQGAVKINGEKLTDVSMKVLPGQCDVFQVGKRRYAKIST